MSVAAIDTAIRFHLSLNVADLDRSVQFLEAVLGVAPAKCRPDYAKFELQDPPLVLSLEPHAPTMGGALNHLGFRLPDSAALVALQRRLELAGIQTQREDGVECCYAKQTKFWLRDPDGALWEFYTVDEDLSHRGAGQAPEQFPVLQTAPATQSLEVTRNTATPAATTAANPAIAEPAPQTRWQHLLSQPFAIPADQRYDEILLQGTFNVPRTAEEIAAILSQSCQALRPGGKLLVHTLTAEDTLPPGDLSLPGPAAAVTAVPVRAGLLAAVSAAGFRRLQLETFRARPCFERHGIALRETLLSARRPLSATVEQVQVVYKGPGAELTDDFGNVLRRGVPTEMPASQWELIRESLGETCVCVE